jgi:hypothetical protein
MLFQVTDITFDFTTDDDELQPEEQLEIINEVCNQLWVAYSEDDLVEEITNVVGWCVKTIEYKIEDI